MKFSISGSTIKKGPEEFSENSVNDSCRDLLEMNADDCSRASSDSGGGRASESPPPPPSPAIKRVTGRQYGQQPKFIRMRELHLLLFYLCRGYEGNLLSEVDRNALFHNLSKRVSTTTLLYRSYIS